jgi:hypothetical protein
MSDIDIDIGSNSDSDDEETNTDGRRLGARDSTLPWTTQEAAGDDEDTQESRATRVSRHGAPQNTSKFNIKRIHIPDQPKTANKDPSTPELGSVQHQVIASWKALFTRPTKPPCSAQEPPTEPTKDPQRGPQALPPGEDHSGQPRCQHTLWGSTPTQDPRV